MGDARQKELWVLRRKERNIIRGFANMYKAKQYEEQRKKRGVT